MRTDLLVCFGLLFAVAASASAKNMGKGKVGFEGEIVEVPCSIATESREQAVSFGDISARSGANLRKEVVIRLVDCELGSKQRPGYIYETAQIKFSGEADPNDPTLLAIKGDAKGLSFHLSTDEGAKISLDTSKHDYELVEGNNTLRFLTELKVDKNQQRAGNFYATLRFIFSYF